MLRDLKNSGDQSHPIGIKLFGFWTVPSTTNNLMNNQGLKFSSPPNDYTSIETILDPKLTTEDCKQAQTPVDPTTGLLHNYQHGKVIMPKIKSTFYDPNEITLNNHEYIPNTLLLAIYNYIYFIENIPILLVYLSSISW